MGDLDGERFMRFEVDWFVLYNNYNIGVLFEDAFVFRDLGV